MKRRFTQSEPMVITNLILKQLGGDEERGGGKTI